MNEQNGQRVNKALKARIVELYETQSNFSVVIGMDEPTISRVVRGRRQLEPEEQVAWAKALDCKAKDIFGERESGRTEG